MDSYRSRDNYNSMTPFLVLVLWAALVSDRVEGFEDGRAQPIFVARAELTSNVTALLEPLPEQDPNHHGHGFGLERSVQGTPHPEISADSRRTMLSHKYRVNHTRGRKIGLQMAIFRVMIKKYAKECKLSKKATKKLVRLFEENPPKIPTKDEDRSEWTDAQWTDERRSQRDYMRRMRTLAFKRVDEHEALTRFFARLEGHEDHMRYDIEHQKRRDLHRMAKAAKLNDAEFNRFMRIREANKANIHWRINMHPNEIKKAENATAESWNKTKLQVLTETSPEQRQNMEQFLSGVDSAWKKTQQKFTGQQNKKHQVKDLFAKILHRRRQQPTKDQSEEELHRDLL